MNEEPKPVYAIEEAPRSAGEQIASTLSDILPEVTKHLLEIARHSKPFTPSGGWDAKGLSNIFRLNNVCVGYIKALAELRKAHGTKEEPLAKLGTQALQDRLSAVEEAIATSNDAIEKAKLTRKEGGIKELQHGSGKTMREQLALMNYDRRRRRQNERT